jgi:hypothetical protein
VSAILGLTLLLWSAGLEVRGAAGVQLDAAPHGILDLGLRSGPWSAELYTDTLDLRLSEADETGRSFVAVRLGALAAQLLFAPWSDGAPDPARALLSPHAALQLGRYEYLGRGLYLGLEGEARAFLFFKGSERTTPAPDPTWVLSPKGVVGYWTPALELRFEASTDVLPDRVAPRGAGYFRLLPEGVLVPRIELWAGSGHKQGDLLRTRLGGLNPYVVPLAGAGWAERWVEDYAVLRIGPHLHFFPFGLTAQLSVVADLAWADGQRDLGLGLLGRLEGDPWFVELSGGYTPTLPRPEGASRLSAFLMAGSRWAGW